MLRHREPCADAERPGIEGEGRAYGLCEGSDTEHVESGRAVKEGEGASVEVQEDSEPPQPSA